MLLTLAALATQAAATGGLDPVFGTGGKASAKISGEGTGTLANDYAADAVVDAQGRIILAGFSGDFGVVRFTGAGVLDATFGSGGTSEAGFTSSSAAARACAQDASGRIVVVGRVSPPAGQGGWPDTGIARFTSSGSLDTSFGSGGRVVISLTPEWDEATDVAIDGNGRILVAVRGDDNFLLARFTSSGALESSFGSGGLASADFAGASDDAEAMLIDSNGRIVLAGESNGRFALARFTSSGALDSSFGSGGKVTTPLPGGNDGGVRDVTLDAQGRIVVAGYRSVSQNEDNFALARYTAAGVLDTSFGGGVISTNFGGSNANGNAVVMDPDGKVLVAGGVLDAIDGSAAGDFAVLRYTSAGVLDTTFGTGGRELIDFYGFRDSCEAALLDPSGRLLLAGSANTSGSLASSRFAVARYLFVIDETPPVITAQASNLSIVDGAAGNQTTVNNWLQNHGGASATDNSGTVTWTNNYSVMPAPGASLSITFTARDPSGNQAVTSAQLIMLDQTPPVFNALPSNLTIVDGAAGNSTTISNWLQNHGGATATDNSGTVTWSHNYTTQPLAGSSGTITFTARDPSGNLSTRTAQMIVLDQTPPQITGAAAPLTVMCDSPDRTAMVNAWLAAHGMAAASDNSGSITWTHNFTTLPGACGVQTITFRAADASGNFATTLAQLTVVDQTAPVISPSGASVTVESDGAGNVTARNAWLTSHGGASATDNCGTVSWSHNFTGLVNTLPQTVPVTFTAIDTCGNSSTTTASFIIQDTTPPQVTLPAKDFYGDCDDAAADMAAYLNSRGSATAADIAGPVTWTHNYNGVLPSCEGYITVTFTATDTAGLSVSTSSRFFLLPPGAVWIGPAAGTWPTATAWRSVVPTAALDTYVDLFDFQNSVVTIPPGGASVKNLSIGAGDTVNIGNGVSGVASLDVNGSQIRNAGTIRINSSPTGSGNSDLDIRGAISLSGTGKVILAGAGTNRIDRGNANPADVLTVGAGQEITATAGTVAEYQHTTIHAGLVNQGLITADGGGLSLYQNPKTNNATFRAINGGLLLMESTINNTGGTLFADATSTLQLATTLTGGQVTGTGRLRMNSTAALAGPVILDTGLTTAVEAGTTGLTGSLTNKGLIFFGTPAGTGAATLNILGPVTLEGSGKLILQGGAHRVIARGNASAADVLTVGAGQEITATAGTIAEYQHTAIHAGLVNNGLITADAGGMTLYLNPKTNNATFRAINGGELLMEAAVTNTSGTLFAGAGSTLHLATTLTGGQVTGPGRLLMNSTAGLTGPMSLDSGLITAVETGTTGLTGSLTNNGVILLGTPAGTGGATLNILGSVTLAGTGKLILQGGARRVIARGNASAADVLTVGAGQEIKATAGTIAEYQHTAIHAGLVNNGLVTTDGSGMTLYQNPKTNSGTFQAINGGLLLMEAAITNTGGTLFADAASTLQLATTLTGGQVTGSGRLLMNSTAGLTGPISLGGGLTAAVEAGTTTLTGTVTNNGSVLLGTAGGPGFAQLNINGAVTLQGSGKVILQGAGNRRFLRANASPADVLTVGAGQEITTTAGTIAEYQNAAIHAGLVNQGTITADQGGLILYQNPKTNYATFRAIRGGRLVIDSALLTNYNAATDTLTGGRYEVISEGTATVMDILSSPIAGIAAGTTVRLSGAGASLPQLSSLTNITGILMLENGKTLATTGNLAIPGVLQFGLPAAPETTRLAITGNVNFTGTRVDVLDLGLNTGSYLLASWTGTLTGAPVLGSLPAGSRHTLVLNAAAKTLRLEITVIPAPKDPALSLAPGTGPNAGQEIVTLTAIGEPGVSYMVEASSDLQVWTPRPPALTSPDGQLSWQAVEPAFVFRRFYRIRSQ